MPRPLIRQSANRPGVDLNQGGVSLFLGGQRYLPLLISVKSPRAALEGVAAEFAATTEIFRMEILRLLDHGVASVVRWVGREPNAAGETGVSHEPECFV